MRVLAILTAIACICIAGSEGPLFPWINLVAASGFGIITIKGV